MNCPKCKAEMPDQAIYCIQCGAKLPGRDHPGPVGTRGGRQRASGSTADAAAEDAPPEQGESREEGVVIGGFRFADGAGRPGSGSRPGQGQGAGPGGFSGKTVSRNGAGGGQGGGPGDEWTPSVGYASPMQRLGAFVLDFLFLGAGTFFMTFVVALVMPRLLESEGGLLAVGNLLPFALALLYYAGLESSRFQATPGKLVLGFKVTDLCGRRISFSRATARHFAKILSGLLFFLGYVMIFFTRRRQGLHDMLAGCVAVRRVEGESTSGSGLRP
ncbi:RDD family protein [Paucidesulfovibrio longus]|uniref:RDD family protein n=1 Tax=Paucidesulfovibrio longus TaxID=889 RepID=UPI0003B70747|nr:RDD family protein [Paucidesulfovibrio longus]